MKATTRIAGTAGFALAATALLAGPAAASTTSGAVFAMSGNLSGHTVVAFDRGTGGSLHQAGVYRTGGLGGQLTGSVVDHTASQGALALDNGLLYAVNAGSDTLTVFDVHGDRLNKRQVIASGGAF